MIDMHCPSCNSENIKKISYMGSTFLRCLDCGFDESVEVEQFPEERSSQKAKQEYNPYQSGGPRRTKKK